MVAEARELTVDGRARANRRQVLRAIALGAAGLGLSACGVDPALGGRRQASPSSGAAGTPGPPATVTFTVNRPRAGAFEPWVMVAPGATGSVQWLDEGGNTLSTSNLPTIRLAEGEHTLRLVASEPQSIQMLNFGYRHDQDSGEMEDPTYNWPKQYVTGITGLNTLTGLEIFMCSDTDADGEQVLSGALDLSGMTQLRQVECFQAQVSSVDLTGCTGLVRLDLERNALSSLDINPVRLTLRDLRAAAQSTGSLAFAQMNEPFPELWHYCVRDQDVTNILTLDKVPKLRQYWIWNTSQKDLAAPISTSIHSIYAVGNQLTQAAVDAVLTGLDSSNPNNVTDATVEIHGGTSAVPSALGLRARASLRSKGWTVRVNT